MTNHKDCVDLIVGGASKCGTTAIYEMLKKNPAFFLPDRKELHFFSRPFLEKANSGPGDNSVLSEIPKNFDEYFKNYSHKRENQIAVDVSPSYLFHYKSAGLIKKALPNVKIVFILRRPEEKVFSQYLHLASEGREILTFEEALNQENSRKTKGFSDMWLYTESGYYSDAICAFQSSLGVENVKVILFDDFRNDPGSILREICLFVGLDGTQEFDTKLKSNVSGSPRSIFLARVMAPNIFTNFLRRTLNRKIGQLLRSLLRNLNTGKKPDLSDDLTSRLHKIYQSDIDKLETLIGRSTGWLKNHDNKG